MQVSLRDRWIALPLSVNCAKCLLRDPSMVARSIDWCANDRFIVRAEQSMDSANRSTARNIYIVYLFVCSIAVNKQYIFKKYTINLLHENHHHAALSSKLYTRNPMNFISVLYQLYYWQCFARLGLRTCEQ